MQPKTTSTMSAQEVQDLQMAIALCNETEQIALKAQDCGDDCRAHLALCQVLRERLSKRLHHFAGRKVDA